jgi:threonine/homoserine/homoserine lactone efflux protein
VASGSPSRSEPEIAYLPDLSVLIPFTIAAIVVVIVPGITVSTVVSTALARGVAGGLWLELGASLARFTMILVVAIALEAVTGVVHALFDVIKYAGAAYLAWLGFNYLTSRSSMTIASGGVAVTPWRQVLSGFVTLWGNPKALLFFGAFLPQFVNDAYPAWPQVLILGLIEMGAATLVDFAYIAIAVGTRQVLLGAGTVWVNRIAGAILIGAAIWLAIQHA